MSAMKTVTVFTPTYNRLHTLVRTFDSLCRQTCMDFYWLVVDDGSTDGTKEWIESIGVKTKLEGPRFDWMGRCQEGVDDNHFVIQTRYFGIEYVYKTNGGLYTGYNVAYQTIQTELCVCVDSDDFMPEDAVEKIVRHWNDRDRSKAYCGLVGLDFNVKDKQPTGGWFDEGLKEAYYMEHVHAGDTKQVMRTDLMRRVAPQIGFEGERDFNPFYMLMQVLDEYPILFLNENLCWVEYQTGGDSMSAAIWKQYWRSPRSYAKYRLVEMSLEQGNSHRWKWSRCVHYVSSCILSRDRDWLRNSHHPVITVVSFPAGVLLAVVIWWKNRK